MMGYCRGIMSIGNDTYLERYVMYICLTYFLSVLQTLNKILNDLWAKNSPFMRCYGVSDHQKCIRINNRNILYKVVGVS